MSIQSPEHVKRLWVCTAVCYRSRWEPKSPRRNQLLWLWSACPSLQRQGLYVFTIDKEETVKRHKCWVTKVYKPSRAAHLDVTLFKSVHGTWVSVVVIRCKTVGFRLNGHKSRKLTIVGLARFVMWCCWRGTSVDILAPTTQCSVTIMTTVCVMLAMRRKSGVFRVVYMRRARVGCRFTFIFGCLFLL